MNAQLQVGPQVANDGANPVARGDRTGALVATLAHGKYTEAALRGVLFHGSTAAAGVLLPASNSAAPTFGLWNPAGSGRNAVLKKLRAGWVGTTGAPGAFLHMFEAGVGSTVGGTGAPITAATFGTPQNALLGSGLASAMKFIPATATLTAAGTILRPTGFSQLTTTGTATFGTVQLEEDIDGDIVVPPGVIWYLAGSAALLSAFDLGLTWEEVLV